MSFTASGVAPPVEKPVEVFDVCGFSVGHDVTHLDYFVIGKKTCLDDNFEKLPLHRGLDFVNFVLDFIVFLLLSAIRH